MKTLILSPLRLSNTSILSLRSLPFLLSRISPLLPYHISPVQILVSHCFLVNSPSSQHFALRVIATCWAFPNLFSCYLVQVETHGTGRGFCDRHCEGEPRRSSHQAIRPFTCQSQWLVNNPTSRTCTATDEEEISAHCSCAFHAQDFMLKP
jgi:hypothetical protein